MTTHNLRPQQQEAAKLLPASCLLVERKQGIIRTGGEWYQFSCNKCRKTGVNLAAAGETIQHVSAQCP